MSILGKLFGFRRSSKQEDHTDHREIGHPESYRSPYSDVQMEAFAKKGYPNESWGNIDPIGSRNTASYEKTKHRNVVEIERDLGRKAPFYINKLRQLLMFRSKDKRLRHQTFQSRKQEDLRLAKEKVKPNKKLVKRSLKKAESQETEIKNMIEENAEDISIPSIVPAVIGSNRNYAFTTVSLLVGEIVGNYIAFMALFREIIIIPALLSFGIAVAISANGKFTGKSLAEYKLHRNKADLIVGIASILITLTICVILGMCRGEIDGSGDSGVAMAALVTLNPFIFLTIVFVAYAHYLGNINRDKKMAHNALLVELKLVGEKVIVLASEYRTLQVSEPQEKHIVFEKYRDLEDELADSELSLVDEMAKLKAEINVHRTDMFRIQSEIQSQLGEVVWNSRIKGILFGDFEKYPESFKVTPKLDPTDMGFGNEVDNYEIYANNILKEIDHLSIDKNKAKKKMKKKKLRKPTLNGASTILLLFSMVLSSCSLDNDKATNIAHLRDTSDGYNGSSTVSPAGIAKLIQSEGDPGHVNFYYQEMNGVDLNPIHHVELEGSFALENPHEREDAIAEFIDSVGTVITSPDTVLSSKYSFIYKPLKRFLEHVKGEHSGNPMTIIIESDFVENTPDYSFLRDQTFQGNPDKAISKLEKAHGQLPNLDRYNFLLVNQPGLAPY